MKKMWIVISYPWVVITNLFGPPCLVNKFLYSRTCLVKIFLYCPTCRIGSWIVIKEFSKFTKCFLDTLLIKQKITDNTYFILYIFSECQYLPGYYMSGNLICRLTSLRSISHDPARLAQQISERYKIYIYLN